MNNIAAGIITYNPNINLLKIGLGSLIKQNVSIYIADNHSENIDEIRILISDKEIKLIENKSNLGIACALNQLMRIAEKNGYKWMITLDQDSVLSKNYIYRLEKYLDKKSNVAIYCPVIYDRNRNVIDKVSRTGMKVGNFGITEIDKCITSGAVTNISIWKAIGGFDNRLFIDGVDFEYCQRAKRNGFKIYQISELILKHSIGNGKILKLGVFKIELHNHSAFRKYYIARNKIYCDYLNNYKFCVTSFLSILKIVFETLLFEENKFKKINSLFKGIIDGIRMVNDER